MRATWIVLAMTVMAGARATAQEPADTVASDDTAAAEMLREEIERRFAERVRTNLGLSNDQVSRLEATQQRFAPRRRALVREYVETERALRRQMRPGVAANPDSVRVYLDAQQRIRAQQLELERDEDRELAAYLTPVQRAQFHQMRRNLQTFVNRVREGRQGRMGGDRPAPRPRGRPLPQRPPRRRP